MMLMTLKMSKCEKKDDCDDENQKNDDCNDENEQTCSKKQSFGH